MRSVLVGVACGVAGMVVAGIAVAVVRARVTRRPVVVPGPEPSAAGPQPGDGSEVPGVDRDDPTADLPADMRPADPSYRPLI